MTQTAFITGAAKRLGRAISLHLAKNDYDIIAHYRGSADDAQALKSDVDAMGRQCHLIQADMSDPEAAKAAIDEALGYVPALDVLINNASRFSYDRPEDFKVEDMLIDYRTNTVSPALLSQAFAQQTQSANPVIINLLDSKLFAMNPDYFSYTLSKYALFAATEAMAMAFAPKTRVCGIAPGVTLPSGPQNQEEFEHSQTQNLLGRGSTPAQICSAIDFILGATAYTGQVITIDGGETLQNRGRDVAFL